MSDLDPTIVVALVGCLGMLVGGLITRGTETKKLIAGAPAGFKSLVDELQEERAADRAEIARLLTRDAVREEEIASLRTRMRGLEADQDVERKRTTILLAHIAELRSALRRAGIAPPPPPPDSGIEDDDGHVSVVVTGTPA